MIMLFVARYTIIMVGLYFSTSISHVSRLLLVHFSVDEMEKLIGNVSEMRLTCHIESRFRPCMYLNLSISMLHAACNIEILGEGTWGCGYSGNEVV